MNQPGRMSRRQTAVFAAILLAGAILRIVWNDVARYSDADEAVYTTYAARVSQEGRPAWHALNRLYIENPSWWVYPNPLRWGYLGLASATCRVFPSCNARALAWLSTAAGILCIPLTFLLALNLFGARTALLAEALTAVSPLQLALGRRALADEVYCLFVLLALLLLMQAVEKEAGRRLWYGGAVVALTLCFAVKETTVLLFPAFAAVLLARIGVRGLRLRHVSLFVLPPVLYYAVFSLLAGNATEFFTLARVVSSTVRNPYAIQYASGPPHRLLFDLFVLAPLVSLLAGCGAISALTGRDRDRNAVALSLFFVLGLLAFALFPAKNLRYLTMLDPAARVLAGWAVAEGPLRAGQRRFAALTAVALADASIELEIFHTIFIERAVYDPMTQNLLDALQAIPGERGAVHHWLFPWLCAAIAAAWWASGVGTRSSASDTPGSR